MYIQYVICCPLSTRTTKTENMLTVDEPLTSVKSLYWGQSRIQALRGYILP